MAGRRRAKGRPSGPERRQTWMRGRIAGASTPGEKAAVALDQLRALAARSPKGPQALEDAAAYMRSLSSTLGGDGT